jgi:hypothetical protein
MQIPSARDGWNDTFPEAFSAETAISCSEDGTFHLREAF